MNVRIVGGCFERESTYLKLVQYKAAVQAFCQQHSLFSEEPLGSSAGFKAYREGNGQLRCQDLARITLEAQELQR